MITFEIKPENEKFLYLQICDYIKQEIRSNHLKFGEKLPSKRNLAKNLGVSVLTVETAYNQLMAEGFIKSIPKSGFFVENIASLIEYNQNSLQQLQPPFTRSDDINNTRSKQGQIAKNNVRKFLYDYSGNTALPENFPFATWAHIMREILNQNQEEIMTKPPVQGVNLLRYAIAKHLYSFRGMKVHPSQIVIGSGTEYLYGLIIQLLGFSRIYAVESPCYSKIPKIYSLFGVKNVKIPLDEKGVEMAALKEHNPDILHISPSHHYPTGIVTQITRRYELLAWANENPNRFLIEDDYDGEFRFNGKPLPTLQSMDKCDKVIYMNTFTKTLSPTIRISYMVLPLRLLMEFKQKMSFYSCTVPNIDQIALAYFIEKGFFERHINRMRKDYCQKKELFAKYLAIYDKQKALTIHESDSGLHMILEVKKENLKRFMMNAKQKRLHIVALQNFYEKTTEFSNKFILNYSSLTKNEIEEAVKVLCEF